MWTGQGLTVGINGGPQDDPDSDGIVNLLEFVLGGNPLVFGAQILPGVSTSGVNLVFTFNVKVAALADYDIVAESSADLVAWAPLVHGANGVSISETTLDPATDQVLVTMPAPARLFVRVKVTAKP